MISFAMNKRTEQPAKRGHAAENRDKKMMIKNLTGASLLISLSLMSGCASYNKSHFTVGSIPDDYRTRHPIIVSENENVRDIVVPASARSMPLRDRDIVRSMGYEFKASGAKSIAILIPSGSANEHAARRLANIAVGELKETGIPGSRIAIRHYNASGYGTSATLRLAFTDLSASVDSKCGQWGEDLVDTRENRNYSNFGCASQNNLAQQIANPADLLGPRAVSEIDSTKRTTVIEDWRTSSTELTPAF